jgi:shikimate kinase
MAPRVVLVGPPGAGKSTVGVLLAERLGVSFRDTDADVEQGAGKSIAEIFFDEGEPRFRELERAAVALALAEHDGVLSLGGGAVLDPTTRDLLKGHRVVFLNVGLTDAARRVGLSRERPVLALNPRATLRSLLEERLPLYRALATVEIATDGLTVNDVVRASLASLASP